MLMRKHLIPINATLSSLPLALSFKSFGFFKGQMIQQMDTVMAMQKLMTELEKGRRSGGGAGVLLCGGCGKGTGNP